MVSPPVVDAPPSDRLSGRVRQRWIIAACVLVYVVIAIAVYWPVSPISKTRYPTFAFTSYGLGDNIQMTWSLAWVAHAVLHGLNPFHSTYLDYPGGAPITNGAPLLGLLVSPVTLTGTRRCVQLVTSNRLRELCRINVPGVAKLVSLAGRLRGRTALRFRTLHGHAGRVSPPIDVPADSTTHRLVRLRPPVHETSSSLSCRCAIGGARGCAGLHRPGVTHLDRRRRFDRHRRAGNSIANEMAATSGQSRACIRAGSRDFRRSDRISRVVACPCARPPTRNYPTRQRAASLSGRPPWSHRPNVQPTVHAPTRSRARRATSSRGTRRRIRAISVSRPWPCSSSSASDSKGNP